MNFSKLLFTFLLSSFPSVEESSPFQDALNAAAKSLDENLPAEAKPSIDRALERDSRSREAWALRARWAKLAQDRDEWVFSLHTLLRLSISQKAAKEEIQTLRKQLEEVDPFAKDTLGLSEIFIAKLLPIAEKYEKERRAHSAIRIHQEILALDPERADSAAAIERISAAPDPSLAETAKPVDLLADVSEEWIRKHDQKHESWKERAKLEREHYITYTNAGYEVLVRAGEAMEQMNAFYREFFNYGTAEDGKSVGRIDLHIFKSREEYLKLGKGPPVKWSGGHFTGDSVECYIDRGGFEGMVGTLFHEAAHQFVSLATSASGWLNEGLASFFEGTRILANGTVLMNLPANHRLFPLVERMSKGWMKDHKDGIEDDTAESDPPKAPTFRIVMENKYEWGPPWYAPTWGVVYFLYNYQDPVDGRFVYRNSFREFINSSGGRVGEGAVSNFEEVVLANPTPRTRGVDFSKHPDAIRLPKTIDELNEVWKDWLTKLRDEQTGKVKVERPYLRWARHAKARKDWKDAKEHFEKGIVANPQDPEILLDFAELLEGEFKNPDRACKLALLAAQLIESKKPVDEKALRKVDNLLAKWDTQTQALQEIHDELWAASKNMAHRYLSSGFPLMAMDTSWRMGSAFNIPGIFDIYEEGVRQSQKTLHLWQLAYNEKNLAGWSASAAEVFAAQKEILYAKHGEYAEDKFEYRFLTLDTVTSGDFSMETELFAGKGKIAFCGMVFGNKGSSNFHALILHPGRFASKDGKTPERGAFVDLTTFYSSDNYRIWRHNPVHSVSAVNASSPAANNAGTAVESWHRMRLDVTGSLVDVWFDGELIITQDFGNLDVLRGGFGLIVGPGSAMFRNIRYLSRNARDPAAWIERKLKMEKLAPTQGDNITGSWLDQVPPWLKIKTWIQEPRKSWDEQGPVPTLLVFWSMNQNDSIPLEEWLKYFQKKWEDIGLNIISVVSFQDAKKVAEYLKEHQFPGSIGIDDRILSKFGESFTMYAIEKFQLPRILLLDINHKVIWEGDPGFRAGFPWKEGDKSYIDDPMDQFVAQRKLRERLAWKAKWKTEGERWLKEGNLAQLLPLLKESNQFEGNFDPMIDAAQQRYASLHSALDAPETLAQLLGRMEREPALEVFIDWAAISDKSLASSLRNTWKKALSGPSSKAWAQVRDQIKQLRGQIKNKNVFTVAKNFANKMQELPGPFSKEFAQQLSIAADSKDVGVLETVLSNGEHALQNWVMREYLKW